MAVLRRRVLLARYFERQLQGGTVAAKYFQIVTRSPAFACVVFQVRGAAASVACAVVEKLKADGAACICTTDRFGTTCLRMSPNSVDLGYDDMDALVTLLCETAEFVLNKRC